MIVLLVFIVTLGLGMPIIFVLGLTSIIYILIADLSMGILVTQFMSSVNNFVLLAIPFFMLAGSIMNSGGLTARMVRFARLLVGNFRGGLGQVTVVSSMIFAGISGSGLADVSAVGSIMIPAMEEEGFNKPFAAAIVASSATIGPIIPPSIDFVLYGMLAQVSVGDLFLGGFFPGVLLGFCQMVYIFFVAKKNGWKGVETKNRNFREILKIIKDALLALIMPLIIIGGILTGYFTPTEASVVAVFYALFVSIFIFRSFNLRELPKILLDAAILTGTILFLVGIGGSLSRIMAYVRLPSLAAQLFLGIFHSKIAILLVINMLILFLGCIMDTFAIMVMSLPVLLPVVYSLGVDPVHFGVIFVLNGVTGMITPPFGLCLFATASISKVSLENIINKIWPFIIVQIIVLLFITFIPQLSLWLPSVMK